MRDFFSDIDWSRWSETAWTTGARVLLIALAIYVALRILQRIVGPGIRAAIASQMEGEPQIEIEKRVETLGEVAYRTLWIVAVLVALITILPEFGINTSALLAGAGLVGLAVGFGAQSLVRDVIGGLFVLIENQYGKGDVVNIAGVGGLVEDVNLRRTLVRDLDGAVHTIPHSTITVTSNLTRGRSRVNMLIAVAHGEDLERVFAVINETGVELARDPAWADDILEAPKTLGVENFSYTGIEIRVLGDTQPVRQWDVMRELRRRLKAAFDREGIAMPGAG